MSWKFNPFTGTLDYYEANTGGGGGSTVDIIHVANYSALPDPTTVGLYDIYIVDNEQGTKWLPGSMGGTYYPSGAYYSDLTKWVYSKSAGQATQVEVNAGTVTDKFVTPETLNNYDRWATLLKKSTNIVTVDTVAGVADFTSIAAAVASITTASSSNPFVVRVNAGLYIEPVVTMKSWVTVKGDSSMNTIVEASSSSNSVFLMADQSMIIDMQVQGSTGTGVSAVVYSSSTTPQTNAIAYAENIRFGANYTHATTIGTSGGNCILQCSNVKYGGYPFTLGFHVTNDGSGIGRMQLRNVTSTNGGVTTTTGLIFAKADQPSCAFIVNGCLLTKATGLAAGTGFWVENGASLRLTAVNFQRWATGIYAPNVGSAPSIYGTALNFENNTKDILVEHPSATGKFEGTDNFLKTEVPIAAPLYEVNKDPRIITVAKKGGNFTSIAAAVNFITGSSITNRYIIQVGPGVFIEPVIDLASHPYVSIIGSSIKATQIQPDANNHDIILLGATNEVSFLTLQNAGAGYAGLSVNDTGDFSQAHKISFEDCSIGIFVQSVTQGTYFYGEYVDFNGVYEYGVKVVSSNGFSAFANLENYYNFSTGGLIACTLASGPNAEVKVVGSGHSSDGTGAAFQLVNGALLTILSTYVDFFDIGVYIENTGAPSNAIITSLDISNSTTWDLFIEHPTASGTFNGSADHTKVNNISPNFAWAYLDSNDAQFEITGKLAITYPTGEHSDISTLLLEGGTMGLIEGGDLTNGGGFTVNISTGYGYYELPISDVVLRKDWSNTSITLSANQDRYIYFDTTGTLTSNGSQPATINNILLGRVVTNGTGIELIDEVPAHAEHTSNRFDNLFRNAMGPIYASGSQVTENVTPFHLNVNSGVYYYASNVFSPLGGNDITFIPTLNGVVQTASQTVPLSWDNAGTLTALTAGQYAKHSIYVVGGTGHEKYYVVYGQTTFASLSAAETGVIPIPPTFIKDAVTLIAGIIVTYGATNITEIIDQRPVVGFRSGGTSASSDHLSLSNLVTGDAGHTQFLMLDGSKPMAATLNMNTHAISNITTLNSISPADWFKKGGNAYGADTIIGLTDAFNLNIRTNNLTRIGVASSGEITIDNLSGAASGVIGATTSGQLTRSVSTTNLPEGTNLYFTDTRAISAPLTGYVSAAGTISTSDSILSAIGKLNGNVSAISGGGVTSVGLTMPSAFTVSNSPITSSGDIAVVGAGTTAEYIRGDGTLATLPTSTSTVSHIVKYGEAITKGQAVYVTSANGTNMIVSKASNTSEATSSKTMGLATTTGILNDQGIVVTEGLLAGLNTNSGNEGDPVWLGVNGDLIFGLVNKPTAPAHLVFIGIITRKSATNGEIFVKVQNGYELNEIHNVKIDSGTLANNDVIQYNSATSLWENKQLTKSDVGLSNVVNLDTSDPTNITQSASYRFVTDTEKSTWNGKQDALTIGNITDVGTDGISVTGGTGAVIGSGVNISQQAASATQNGYLSSTDWNTFNSAAPVFIPALTATCFPRGYYANNGSATMSVLGNANAATISGTAAAISIANTNTLTRTIRLQVPTTSTAGAKAGIRSASLYHSVGQGFYFSVGWCIQDAAYVAGAKQFHGFLPITTLGTLSNTVDNSSLINFLGVGSDAADTNLQVFCNDGVGTASKVDLGVNFPANRTAGAALNNFYVFEMYNAPGTTSVKYRITERSTGNTAQGELTTDLPLDTVLLGIQAIRTNGATTLATVNQWSHLIAYTI